MKGAQEHSTERVVVTGVGGLAAGCQGADDLWRLLQSGETAVAPLASAGLGGSPCRVGGEIEEIDKRSLGLSRKELRYLDVVSTYGLVVAKEAIASAGLDGDAGIARDEIGFAIGLSSGPLSLSRHEPNVNLFSAAVSAYYGSVIGNITIPLRLSGPSSTHLTLDLAGIDAIGYAYEVVRHRKALAMLAGGSDSGFNTFVLAQLDKAGLLSTGEEPPRLACRHSDSGSHGTVLGEGAGLVVVESLESALERGAPVLAEVLGYRSVGAGRGAAGMKSLLAGAGVEPGEIDCIVGHATGSPEVDQLQVECFEEIFGEMARQPPLTRVDWALGHTLGAAGALQAVAAASIVARQSVPAVGSLTNGDGSCCLNQLKQTSSDGPVRLVLESCFGLARGSSFLLFGKYE